MVNVIVTVICYQLPVTSYQVTGIRYQVSGILETISTYHPYRTRNATMGRIRYGETFRGDSRLGEATFKYRAVHWFNQVPTSVYSGGLAAVKHKLRAWVWKNVAVDWG